MIRGTIEGLLSVNVPYGSACDHGLFFLSGMQGSGQRIIETSWMILYNYV